jgi:hypothetical protein
MHLIHILVDDTVAVNEIDQCPQRTQIEATLWPAAIARQHLKDENPVLRKERK